MAFDDGPAGLLRAKGTGAEGLPGARRKGLPAGRPTWLLGVCVIMGTGGRVAAGGWSCRILAEPDPSLGGARTAREGVGACRGIATPVAPVGIEESDRNRGERSE